MKYLLTALLLSVTTIDAPAQTYSEAKSGIAAGDPIDFYSGLTTHPLYPYLAADYYNNHLDDNTAITALFDQYYSARPIKSLHDRWVRYHFSQGHWELITQHYYDSGDETANCMYRQSQLLLGNHQQALEQIESTWFSPNSVSEYCDPVFDYWGKGRQSQYLIKRAKLAYHAGNVAFAQHLANQSTTNEAMIIAQFSGFVQHPTQLLTYLPSELTRTPLHRELLPLALEKLVRKDSSQYAQFAMQFAPTLKNETNYQRLLGKLTGYLVNRYDAQAKQSYALIQSPDKDTTEAFLRFSVGSRDWSAIRRLISLENNQPMALYWLGRALEAQGKNPRSAYQKAARTRSYYGFLAADKLNQRYQFNIEPIVPNATIQADFNQNLSLIRGRLLHQYGDGVAARREIIPLANRMPKPIRRQLAYWLSQQGMHFEAIYILGQLRDWNDINVRFPTPYNHQVQLAHQLTQVDKTWIYAIIRQESSMNPRAVSRARAKGLMQLIPSTARRMARDLGLSLKGSSIFDPSINTQLGANYLSQMYQRFGNLALASAAYNAGPGRIEQWRNNGLDDMPIWIEKIPFNETRKYVKHIIEYQQVYAMHLGETIPTVTTIITQKPTLLSDENLLNSQLLNPSN